jgi:hypothetical protein
VGGHHLLTSHFAALPAIAVWGKKEKEKEKEKVQH